MAARAAVTKFPPKTEFTHLLYVESGIPAIDSAVRKGLQKAAKPYHQSIGMGYALSNLLDAEKLYSCACFTQWEFAHGKLRLQAVYASRRGKALALGNYVECSAGAAVTAQTGPLLAHQCEDMAQCILRLIAEERSVSGD